MNKPEIKLIARNAPAFRKSLVANPRPHLVAGNPISTRLEASIGNCFPGLECDLRNLERRFFPFLEMDMPDARIDLIKVDMAGAQAAWRAGKISRPTLNGYRKLHAKGKWTVFSIKGQFGSLGERTIELARLGTTSTGADRLPIDPWTAVRLLTEATDVVLVLERRRPKPRSKKVTVKGKRAKYLGDDGALAEMFLPGELTQSLCSPWTHDFRDCACFYWASNHPDIAMPPTPTETTQGAKWNLDVPWERSDRRLKNPPDPATFEDPTTIEMRHLEINKKWQKLNFVMERREQIRPYVQQGFSGVPLPDKKTLEIHLRYAAGVELAVLQEYLTAAFSLKPEAKLRGELRTSVRAAYAQIMQIAIGEMRHLRAVNDVLASLLGRSDFKPALDVATELPGAKAGSWLQVKHWPLNTDAQQRFIEIEAPSESVDGVYSQILATLQQENGIEIEKKNDNIQAISTVMAEGADHYEIFKAIQEWLRPYKEADYLRSVGMTQPPDRIVENQTLQRRYVTLLNLLHDGYQAGMPFGAADLNTARSLMIGNSRDKLGQSGGIISAAQAVAAMGYLVVFQIPEGGRFTTVNHP